MARRSEEEARIAKENAEKLFIERDYNGARRYALRAQMLCPTLEGIAQMTATFHVYAASEVKINGETDLYAILGLQPSVLIKTKVRRQYEETSLLLHPHQNKTIGADGAFRLHSEAWETVSDLDKRISYDTRRNSRGDSFWTICTACNVQYEYLRKYHNKKLSCKNCRGIFVAIETGLAPPNGSYAYTGCQHFPAPENGSANQHIPITGGVVGSHSGQRGSNCVSNHSLIHRGSYSGSSSAIGNTNVTALEAHTSGNANHNKRSIQEPSRMGRPSKRKRVEDRNAETASSDMRILSNGNGSTRSYAAESNFDSRSLLVNRAQSELRKKLEEIRRSYAEIAALKRNLTNLPRIEEAAAGDKSNNNATISGYVDLESEVRGRTAASGPITVPDSDFHDFDKDRSEECFKAKQIWAIYDAEDGMPRLYCTIRQVISLRPFKVVISYMNSKTDSEFGSVKWIESGFTKSCGKFRTWKTHVVDQVNIFSHLLNREKTRRGGCLRIYPRAGEIWAIYKNWSLDWNRSTPNEVRREFEMVEILDDYDEKNGVCMSRLVKTEGYNTVYGRNRPDKDGSICRVSKKEMLRFSHRVPCWPIRGGEGTTDLPEWCWDLDPAATICLVPSSPPTPVTTAAAEM